jgi:hypothetical protein
MAWFKRFYDPIILPDGRIAARCSRNTSPALPKAEHYATDWQVAIETLLLVAERDGPEMLAQIAVTKGLNRHGTKAMVLPRRQRRFFGSLGGGSI